MSLLTRLDNLIVRAFNPGAVAVDNAARVFGVPTEQWSSAEYGSYIASSNAVYTVVKKRATYLSSLPLKLARLKADGETDPVTSGALYDLMRMVNPFWTTRRLIEMTEMSLCLWGAAYWMLERGEGGTQTPRAIYWARPDRVRVFPHSTEYIDHFEYEPVSGQEPLKYAPSEVIWFRYPNPLDEYSGLSPLAAARLAADTQSAAMKENFAYFKNGASIGGLVTPSGDRPMNRDQAQEIRDQLRERARGAANAHRWLVLVNDAKFQPMSLSPKDAEFVNLHKMTLEDIARPYGIPLDLIGGQRTYENLDAAIKLMWTDTIVPEAGFIADELTEQLLPMFSGRDRADVAFFDHSDVEALQDDEEAKWRIAEGQIKLGAITVNEWRAEDKRDPVEWGDAWWGSLALVPITTAELPELEQPPSALPEGENNDQEDEAERALDALFGARRDAEAGRLLALAAQGRESQEQTIRGDRGEQRANGRAPLHTSDATHGLVACRIAYDSDEHRRIWRQFTERTEKHEPKVARTTRRLMRQQEQSILTELGKLDRSAIPVASDLGDGPHAPEVWLTDAQWAGLRIVDPDGWDRRNFDEDWERPITRAEFADRLARSTVDFGSCPETRALPAIDELMLKLFSIQKWRRRFREAIRPVFGTIVADAGQTAIDEVTLGGSFDVGDPLVARFLERRTQRFAVEINATTWERLKASLSEGLEAGEGTDDLAKRVRQVMGDRIRSSEEVIARSEVISSYTGGQLAGAAQSGQIATKTWLCVAGDTRVSGMGVRYVARRRYTGSMIRLETMSGRVVTVTAQHPILTRRGWVAAEDVREGDDLIRDPLSVKWPPPDSGMMPDVDDMPPTIEELFNAALDQRAIGRSVRRVMYLDGEGRYGEIDVVAIDSELRDRLQPTSPERFRQGDFVLTDQLLSALVAQRTLGAVSVSHAATKGRRACCGNTMGDSIVTVATGAQDTGLRLGTDGCVRINQDAMDCRSRTFPTFSNSEDRVASAVFPGDLGGMRVEVAPAFDVRDRQGGGNLSSSLLRGHLGKAQKPSLASSSEWFTESLQAKRDRAGGAVKIAGDLLGSFPVSIPFDDDRCVRIERSFGDCHVYDYTTENGWMIANGLVVHNSALDDRVRDTHVEAHGQTVPLDANYTVGGSTGPGPGLIEAASESIQCRCTQTFGLKPLVDEA